MLTKRIIACLDVHDGKVVKGVRFQSICNVGDPAELAASHAESGADEIVMLDVSATTEGRPTSLDTVRLIAQSIFIPFTVGGGIRSLRDAEAVFEAGADKVSMNSIALSQPELISNIAKRYGSQAAVVAIDAKRSEDGSWFEACIHGGRKRTGKEAIQWAREATDRGAGEILLTSMDCDGTRSGFDCELTKALASNLQIPVIASGGGGNIQTFIDVFERGQADAALAASIFHFDLQSIRDLKQELCVAGIPMRWPC